MSLLTERLCPVRGSSVASSAPCRIDLAGGTLDIWPVCQLLGRPAVTLNLAIELRARVEAEARSDGLLTVESADWGETVRMPVRELRHGRMGLASRLVAWFGAGEGVSLRMRAEAPPQSGLGGSSAMAVALAGALASLRDRPLAPDALLTLVQNVETAHLETVTGYQDYVPALLGGLHALVATPGGVRRDRLDAALPMLQRHLLLADTRVEHQSGIRNWEMVRAFLEGDSRVRASFLSIASIATEMRGALESQDLAAFAEALDREWQERRRLAPGVTNAAVDGLEAAARKAGARAGKICGAGGGGCMIFLCDDPASPALARAVHGAGGRVLAWKPAASGLRVEAAAAG
ncbi:MAG: GHMP family kinase ATP-binding protein [Planctomycetaceae bacterium]